jgi:hypothetical protein
MAFGFLEKGIATNNYLNKEEAGFMQYMQQYRDFRLEEWKTVVMTVPYGHVEKEGEVYIPLLMNENQEMLGLKESVENKNRQYCEEGGWLLGWNRN